MSEELKEKAGEVVEDIKEKAGDIKDKAADIVGDIKDKAGDIAADLKGKAGDLAGDAKAEAKEAVGNVKDEATEVFKEAKAFIKGEKLESADTEGGAGYRSTENKGPQTVAIAAIAAGAVALICAFLGWKVAIAGIVVGIIATALGAKARKINQTGLATIGLLCGLGGTLASCLALVLQLFK